MVESAKPQIQWLGHAGFKIKLTHGGDEKVIYIDTWLENPFLPGELKDNEGKVVTPDDADLIWVTHGHLDHV